MLCIHGSLMSIKHQYGSMLCIRHQAQCCASGIKNNYSSMLLIRHQCGCKSCINMSRCWCIHGSKMHIRHQYRLMLYISAIKIALYYGSMLCIMHQYGSMLCINGSMMCIRHQYGTILLNAVQELIYGLMLWIRHHNTAQTCPSCKMWFIHDSSCASCINMAQYRMSHHTKLTTSYFVHFLFCYFVWS